MSGTGLFLDTTTQIGRFAKPPEMQAHIKNRMASVDSRFTSLVVRKEFKSRLLQDANYMLRVYSEASSTAEVIERLSSLPQQQNRKLKIGLDLLATCHRFEDVNASDTDHDRMDRAKLFLHDLLVSGLERFEDDCILIEDSSCQCGRSSVKILSPFKKYDLGLKRCSLKSEECGIKRFLDENRDALKKILGYLKSIPEKTDELQEIENFTAKFLSGKNIDSDFPCNTVGDLLIALESQHIPLFYTMNYKESQHLCAALGQTMIFRPTNKLEHDQIDGKPSPPQPKAKQAQKAAAVIP